MAEQPWITDREVGRLFRTFRIGLDLNQRETAAILDVPRSAISLIESGQRKLTVTEALTMIRTAMGSCTSPAHEPPENASEQGDSE